MGSRFMKDFIAVTLNRGLVFSALCALALPALAATPTLSDQDLQQQAHRSLEFLLQNISPEGSARGAVVAAPSRAEPDYYYHWVRDAALTFDSLFTIYDDAAPDVRARLRPLFLDHLEFNRTLQANSSTEASYGEPKFLTDGSLFTGPWGRPQNDGPALRAASMIRLQSLALREGWPQANAIQRKVYDARTPSVGKTDLEYVAHRWRDWNFDLWEEVFGLHFYTLMAQRLALTQGAQIADALGDPGAADFYRQQLAPIEARLDTFWSASAGYVRATLYVESLLRGLPLASALTGPRFRLADFKSQLDASVLLAVLHADVPGRSFSFDDDRMLSTYLRLRDSFRSIYTVNGNHPELGTAFGRYPEDTYDGYRTDARGNPWVLTTAGAAEFLYRSILKFHENSRIVITAENVAFFTQVAGLSSAAVGQTIVRGDARFTAILGGLRHEADRLLLRVLFHKNSDGSLSEQINRENGFMQGAPNLTWSHASILTAKHYRDRVNQIVRTPRR